MAEFVSRNCLSFDLQDLIERAVSEWSINQALGLTRPVAESCGDFIAAEMEAIGLRRWIDDEVLFNSEASQSEFSDAVCAGLDKWLVKVEISLARSPEEMEEYWKRCGE